MANEPYGFQLTAPEYLAEPATATLRVREVDFREDPRWLQFISQHPDALIYHHPTWLSALESEYRGKCIALACEDADGEIQGILPLLYTRGLPIRISRHQVGRRLSSLPRTPLAGPLATSNLAAASLVKAAIDYVRNEPGLRLELKTTIPDLDKLVDGLQCIRWRDTYVRGLPDNRNRDVACKHAGTHETRTCAPCDTCRLFSFGNSRDNHQVKWAVNKAVKHGLSMRIAETEDELRAWYRMYLDVMRRNVVPPRPYRLFQRLWREMRSQGHMILVLAERNEERPGVSPVLSEPGAQETLANPEYGSIVGGSILLSFGDTVFWSFTGTEKGRSGHHSNDLTLWHCMRESCKQGYDWFDLGEVAENHPELSQFKAKWGTIQRPMYRYYYPACPQREEKEDSAGAKRVSQFARFVWQKLPLNVVAVLGNWIFSYL